MKKILALALAMIMVLALCACGAKEEAPAAPEAPAAAPAAPEAPEAPAEAPAAPAEGDASGEMGASGEPSGGPSGEQLATSADFEIEVNGVAGTAHYEDTDNGDQATKGFVITFDGATIEGAIDKGVWTAADAANQAVVDAVKAAFEGSHDVGNG